ncbi:MAG: hypothetical protein M5U09_04570 [Gammaproteobacteria bacterium]|nr:hypothetical protein [Gammaproteobacteria bacterium]
MDARSDDAVRTHRARVADLRRWADDGAGFDAHVAADPGGRVDHRRRVHARDGARATIEVGAETRQRQARVADLEHRPGVRRGDGSDARHQHGGRRPAPCCRGGGSVAVGPQHHHRRHLRAVPSRPPGGTSAPAPPTA